MGFRSAEPGQELIHPTALHKLQWLCNVGAQGDISCNKVAFLAGDLSKALRNQWTTNDTLQFLL